MKLISQCLDRFFPDRLKQKAEITPAERLRLFSQVSENDNCLRAVLDVLQETLHAEFQVAINPREPDLIRLRACEGMRLAYYNIQQIERERGEAKQAREQEEAQRRNPSA